MGGGGIKTADSPLESLRDKLKPRVSGCGEGVPPVGLEGAYRGTMRGGKSTEREGGRVKRDEEPYNLHLVLLLLILCLVEGHLCLLPLVPLPDHLSMLSHALHVLLQEIF